MKFIKLVIALLVSFNAFCADIVINKDTTIMSSWTIPNTTILRFETGGHITAGTTGLNISGGIIQAAYTQEIFDTLLTVIPYATYSGRFSSSWFGVNPTHTARQNRIALQKAINTCLTGLRLFSPKGTCNLDTSVYIQSIQEGDFVGCTLDWEGESNRWAPEAGSVFIFQNRTGNGIALQQNKGTKIKGINIRGQWANPVFASDSAFFNCTYSNYRDFTVGQVYFGLHIDYRPNMDENQNHQGGSSGCTFVDMNIGNFTIDIGVSYGGYSQVTGKTTLNGDELLFDNVQLGDCKVGFLSTQGQEKGNIIRNIVSWGTVYVLFSSGNENLHQGGNYGFEGGNIAGKMNRIFMVNQGGWGIITVNGPFFAEQIGSIGSITSDNPVKFVGTTFHFADPTQTGANHNLLNSNNVLINFDGCFFAYFTGNSGPMNFSGDASSINCKWSNTIINNSGSMFIYQMPPLGGNFKWKIK